MGCEVRTLTISATLKVSQGAALRKTIAPRRSKGARASASRRERPGDAEARRCRPGRRVRSCCGRRSACISARRTRSRRAPRAASSRRPARPSRRPARPRSSRSSSPRTTPTRCRACRAGPRGSPRRCRPAWSARDTRPAAGAVGVAAVVVRLLGADGRAGPERRRRARPAGVLPLGLARQAIRLARLLAEPRAVGLGIVPGHVDHRPPAAAPALIGRLLPPVSTQNWSYSSKVTGYLPSANA